MWFPKRARLVGLPSAKIKWARLVACALSTAHLSREACLNSGGVTLLINAVMVVVEVVSVLVNHRWQGYCFSRLMNGDLWFDSQDHFYHIHHQICLLSHLYRHLHYRVKPNVLNFACYEAPSRCVSFSTKRCLQHWVLSLGGFHLIRELVNIEVEQIDSTRKSVWLLPCLSTRMAAQNRRMTSVSEDWCPSFSQTK